MKTYADALAKLNGRNSRKIANNTYLRKETNGNIVVRLHSTDIITFTPDDLVTLNSGGWKTVTTKARMNEFSPFQIAQERGIWRVANPKFEDYVAKWTHSLLYADGITVDAKTGEVMGAAKGDESELRKRIGKYAKGFVDALYKGKVPKPSGGDCWMCLGLGKTDKEHLLSHMEESYFVPSLIVNAVKEFANAPAWFWGLDELFEGKRTGLTEGKWPKQTYTRALRRYLYRGLGLVS